MTTKQAKTKKKSTQKNDIATSTITPNSDATVATGSTQPPGSKAEAEKMIAQGGRSLELAALYAVALAVCQYTDSDVQELDANRTAFDNAFKKNQAARKASKEATASHRVVVQNSVVFRDKLVGGLKVTTQGKQNPFKNPKLMLSKTTQPAKLALWYRAVANEVSDNQAALTARFGQDAVALLESKTAELDKSNAMQSVNRAALPVATAEQRAAQVTLAASIAKLRYCAEIAFAGNKAVLKEFVPLWSKKRRASEKASEPQPGSGDLRRLPPIRLRLDRHRLARQLHRRRHRPRTPPLTSMRSRRASHRSSA